MQKPRKTQEDQVGREDEFTLRNVWFGGITNLITTEDRKERVLARSEWQEKRKAKCESEKNNYH